MNLDPNNTLILIDGTVHSLRDLRYGHNRTTPYSQDETLCLLGLLEEGLWGSELYNRFDDEHPGRTKKGIRQKTRTLRKRHGPFC